MAAARPRPLRQHPGGDAAPSACPSPRLTAGGYETVMLKERFTSGLTESMPDS